MPQEQPLKDYKMKRDFIRTPEPQGNEVKPHEQPIFVIQKHDATRLHYDFRLEVNGVLKSWAVPKGPSMDPGVRHLAIQTDDHPLDYSHFEGIIPEGNYGAGVVMVWDTGIYRSISIDQRTGEHIPMDKAIEQGKVEVWLEGKRLNGGFALIRIGKGGDGKWLLIKMRDKYANAGYEPLKSEPDSVLSGLSLEQIAGKSGTGTQIKQK